MPYTIYSIIWITQTTETNFINPCGAYLPLHLEQRQIRYDMIVQPVSFQTRHVGEARHHGEHRRNLPKPQETSSFQENVDSMIRSSRLLEKAVEVKPLPSSKSLFHSRILYNETSRLKAHINIHILASFQNIVQLNIKAQSSCINIHMVSGDLPPSVYLRLYILKEMLL